MKFIKKVSVGAFAKKGVDFKDGDILTLLDEGRQIEGTFGIQNVFKVKLVNGEEKNISINQTSINKFIDAYGDDSKSWIGKEIKCWIISQNVSGKFLKVAYFTAPNQTLDDDAEEIEYPE